MLKEFREFAMRGNLVDIAVGLVLGAAFGAIVASLVNDVLMPPIGLLLGGADFSNLFLVLRSGSPAGPYATPAQAQAAGAVTLNYGVLINTIIIFLITAFALFMVIRAMNRLRRRKAAPETLPETKACRFCFTTIPVRAVRCPNCTSELPGE